MKCIPPELATEFNFAVMNDESFKAKHHTIRNGNRWKVGDKFSPRVWSGKPYASKQIAIAPDIEIKKIWDFEIKDAEYYLNGKALSLGDLKIVAENDGLTVDELECWFNVKEFSGQIMLVGFGRVLALSSTIFAIFCNSYHF